MTEAEITERVEAWIREHGPRIRDQYIIDEWRDVSERWGASSGAACGALLALVREACGDPKIHAMPSSNGQWYVWDGASIDAHSKHLGKGDAEPLALLAALEAAPVERLHRGEPGAE